MLFDGGFSFANFLVDVLAVFIFVVWFWLLITVFSDLFRRNDISGWGKALWVIVLILLPYIGVFVYMISQGRGMADRNAQYAQQARDETERQRRTVAVSAYRTAAMSAVTPGARNDASTITATILRMFR